MNVKEAVSVLKAAEQIVLGYGANAIPFEKDDPLALDAFGKYKVDSITSDDGKYFEINLVTQFVKDGD